MAVTNSTLKETAGNLVMAAGKITGLANGSASDDGAAFGQIPTAYTSTPAAGTLAGSAGSSAQWSKGDHAHPMSEKMLMGWSGLTILTGTGVNYIGLADSYQAPEARSQMVIPNAGTLTAMYGIHGTAVTTSDETYTGRVNGVDTALTFAIVANATANSITGQSVSVAAGDKVSVKVVSSVSNTTSCQGRIAMAYK